MSVLCSLSLFDVSLREMRILFVHGRCCDDGGVALCELCVIEVVVAWCHVTVLWCVSDCFVGCAFASLTLSLSSLILSLSFSLVLCVYLALVLTFPVTLCHLLGARCDAVRAVVLRLLCLLGSLSTSLHCFALPCLPCFATFLTH